MYPEPKRFYTDKMILKVFVSLVGVIFHLKNNIFLFFKKLFLTSMHQNNLKTPKKY
jgi:hypothetical protein